jgi:hypothetical protein
VKLSESTFNRVEAKMYPMPVRSLPYTTNFATQELIEKETARSKSTRALWVRRSKQISKKDLPWREVEFFVRATADYEDTVDLMRLCLINRQHATGGGRWFTDGLREYAATKPKERADSLRAVKNGKFTPLEKLLDDGAWSKEDRKISKRGASDEADYWGQSAMWMEFLREGPWPKDKFPRFVQTVGSLPKGDRARIQSAIESIYGMDLGALQKKWVEFFTKH